MIAAAYTQQQSGSKVAWTDAQIMTQQGAAWSCHRQPDSTYLEPSMEAEKSSLLNMAIDPVTTALALLRACNKRKKMVWYTGSQSPHQEPLHSVM